VLSVTSETLRALLDRLPRYGDRPAVGLRRGYGTRWWSYRRLHEEAWRAAARLGARGGAPGARVLLWAGNSPEWAGVLLGAVAAGVVVVPVDETASPHWVRHLVEAIRPVLVVHGPDQDVDGIACACCPVGELFAVDGPPAAPPRAVAADPDDAVLILYSSGTTREPTGVILTHRNLVSQLHAFDRWRWVTRWLRCRMLVLSPLSHVQGLLMGLCVPLALGLSALYSESVDPAHVIRTIRQNRITLLLAVPRVQRLLARALQEMPYGRGGRSLSERVRTIRFFPWRRHLLFLATHAQLGYSFWVLLVGGAPLPSEDERFWYECGYVLVQGYGLTETTALVSLKINHPFGARPGSIGSPLPHYEVRIGEDGEVLVRGPSVSHRVFGDGHAAGDAPADGFLHTGDLATRDARGQLYLVGRKKDVIVTGEGLNVHPGDVEAALERVPGVREAVVVGLARRGITEVHAVLLLTPEAAPERVIADANRTLEAHQQVRGWTLWPDRDFPRAGLLKVRRDDVARRVQELQEAGAAAEEADAERPSLAEIRATGDPHRRVRLLARYLSDTRGEAAGEDAVSVTGELGLSSLDTAELVTLLERDLSRPLDWLAITSTTTVGHLRAVTRAAAPARAPRRLPSRQPAWSRGLLGRCVRLVSQPLLIGAWAITTMRLTVEWAPGAAPPEGPCIVAAAPHYHWLDSFVMYAALPRRARRRLVTVANVDFSEFFAPRPGVSAPTRLLVGLVYYLCWPLAFSFVVLPGFGDTRAGLHDLSQLIEAGDSPIATPDLRISSRRGWDRGGGWIAVMAREAGLPIVPVWMEGNDDLRLWPFGPRTRVRVRVGPAMRISPAAPLPEVIVRLEEALDRLAAGAGNAECT